MATTPPSSSGGGAANMLTKKYGPLPGWAWLGIIVVGVYIYRKRQAASTAASSTTQGATGTTATGVPTETLSGAGGSYSGPVGYAPPGVAGTTPGNTGTTFVPPTGETLRGSGYGAPSGSPTVAGASGQSYSYISTPAQAAALQQSGQALYYQPTPGNFIAEKAGQKVAPGTPEFAQVP